MRFDNFDNSWNKSPLKNLCTFLKGNGVSKDELNEEGQPCILYGELYTTYKTSKIKEIKSRTMLNNSNLVRSKKNDVIIPCSGETAIDIATSICVPMDNIILGGDLTIIRSSLNGEFLSNQINSVRRKEIATIAQGASIVHLHADDLKNIEINYPTLKEQQKIAHFIGILDDRLETQSKIIDGYKSLIKSIRNNMFATLQCDWKRLDLLIKDKEVVLKRGNIIPKHERDNEYKYPVYSSSVQKNGLMGYSNYFMFDTELITWSIDGGGNIFYRKPHNFCVTNVCGIMELNKSKFNYMFVSEALKYQHSKMVFDYQTKAHPSVIEKLYSLPIISIDRQNNIAKLFNALLSKITIEEDYLAKLKEQKKYLLSNMFI